eukprot:TRINITY_DN12541_c0_g1_i1.p1 TRINITY_DN12541_c0_g1~~TRINITY_DN12541_c0_g1_i1.p1  ORF type:complete len:388 (-),score=77.64 TRINITY_DN12541_c0_g1_i1:8-1081(-)
MQRREIRIPSPVFFIVGACAFLFFLQFELYQSKVLELEEKLVAATNVQPNCHEKPKPGMVVTSNPVEEKPPATQSIGTTKDLQNLFDYGCTRRGRKIAVVTQFIASDVAAIVKQINRWKHPLFQPCSPKPDNTQVDLIYFQDYPIEESVVKPIKDKLASMKDIIDGCFGEVRFLSSGLPDTILSKGKMDSNGNVFYSIYDALIPLGYDYFFMMESDTQPIRSNWVQKLVAEASCGQDFWIKGSVNRNIHEYAQKAWGYHINGNALYHTCRNWEFCYNWTRFQLADLYGNAYDYATWWCYWNPKNVQQTRDMMHYYSFSDFVQNQYHEVTWSSSAIRESSPNTYFVHGKNRQQDEGDS